MSEKEGEAPRLGASMPQPALKYTFPYDTGDDGRREELGQDDTTDRAAAAAAVVRPGAEVSIVDETDVGTESERRSSHGSSAVTTESRRNLKRRFSYVAASQFTFRMQLRRIIHHRALFGGERVLSEVYRSFTVILVTASTLLFIINSMPTFYQPMVSIDVSQWYFDAEVVLTILFTLDFLVRLSVMVHLVELRSIHLVIDLASFAGTYIEISLAETAGNPNNSAGFTLLRLLRLARILRLFKLGRQDAGVPMLWRVLMKSKDGLFLLVVLVSIATLVFSSILYYIELVTCSFDDAAQEWIRDDGTISPFQSIPHTFWFVAQAITTVGYGDQVPGNLGGRAWTVVVMFFGVFLLSFPNILIGSNFSEVHAQTRREQSRKTLGKYFRKVRVVVRFIRMWREFRIRGRIRFVDEIHAKKNGNGLQSPRGAALVEVGGEAGDTGSITNGSERSSLFEDPAAVAAKVARRTNFFMMRIGDFPERGLIEVASKGARGALDQVVLNKFSLLLVMQRLLECFSGCASVEELAHSFLLFQPEGYSKPPTIDVVFELVLRGGALQVLTVFVLHREDESALVQITKKGIDMLLTFREVGGCPCVRCYAEAREVWHTTTKQPGFDFLPLDGYRSWQGIESQVPKRSPLDFTYDFKLTEAQLNDVFKDIQLEPTTPGAQRGRDSRCQCRHCNMLWGMSALMRPKTDYCFDPDDELLELEISYIRNVQRLLHLERQLEEAAAEATNVPKETPKLSPKHNLGGSMLGACPSLRLPASSGNSPTGGGKTPRGKSPKVAASRNTAAVIAGHVTPRSVNADGEVHDLVPNTSASLPFFLGELSHQLTQSVSIAIPHEDGKAAQLGHLTLSQPDHQGSPMVMPSFSLPPTLPPLPTSAELPHQPQPADPLCNPFDSDGDAGATSVTGRDAASSGGGAHGLTE